MATTLKKVSGMDWLPIYNVSRGIFMFFTETDIIVTSETLLMSFNAFISAIGGSLGLFLGFSGLAALTFCLHQFQKKCTFGGNKSTQIDE